MKWIVPLVYAALPFTLSLVHAQDILDVTAEAPVFQHTDEIRQENGFGVLAERRIFATMAFLNAVGYDEEVQGMQMTPTRLKVRERLQKTLAAHPEQLAMWRQYYAKHDFEEYVYVNFAFSLSAEYPFRRIRPKSELWNPEIAKELTEFPGLLNSFWQTAHLEELWTEVKPDYLQELAKYDFKQMAADRDTMWGYLRMEPVGGQRVIEVPDLLNRHNEATGSRFGDLFYSADGPGGNDYSLNVHKSLHPITQPILRLVIDKNRKKLTPYFEAGQGHPQTKPYGTLFAFVDESLVHALTARIDIITGGNRASTREWAEGDIVQLTEGGLTLAKPFYQLLGEYEKSGKSFCEYLPVLLEKLPEYVKADGAQGRPEGH
jgi:hypothetical protein